MSREHPAVVAVADYARAEELVRPWATSPSANALWLDDTSVWALRTGRTAWWSLRRHRVVFPHPSTLDVPEDLERWEAMARVVAAEHTSNGAFGTWVGSIAAGLAFGVASTVVVDSLSATEASYWVRLVAGAVISVLFFGAVTLLVFATTGRALVRAYEHGPLWTTRAEAYARRRRQLDVPHPALERHEASAGLSALRPRLVQHLRRIWSAR